MKRNKRVIATVAATIGILGLLLAGGVLTDRAVDIFSWSNLNRNSVCVVIDAGHGGVDGGAVSCTGVEESEINLQIALRLSDLMHFLGIDTYMIRSEDISVYTTGDTIAAKKISDLKERVRIVNETENAMLISIHQNHYKDSRYSGAQVFYHSDAALAKQLQTAFVDTLSPTSKRKVKKGDGVYLLQNINCPAALIECGFLSNAQEEASLRTDAYQKKICCVIGCVVSCYIYNSVA